MQYDLIDLYDLYDMYDLLTMSMNLCDIVILEIKNFNYCFIITGISKSEAINLL